MYNKEELLRLLQELEEEIEGMPDERIQQMPKPNYDLREMTDPRALGHLRELVGWPFTRRRNG